LVTGPGCAGAGRNRVLWPKRHGNNLLIDNLHLSHPTQNMKAM